MLALNRYIFLLLNAPAHASPAIVILAEFAAADLVPLVPPLMVALWIWGSPAHRSGLIATTLAASLALGANQLVGFLWYEPRPFMAGIGRTLMAHAPDNSFPSDHSTFLLTVGLGLLSTRAAPFWGKVVIAFSILVAWARIYLGLHFPIDMLASGALGAIFGGTARIWIPALQRWVIPCAERAYECALRSLHLPPRAFPRRRV